MIKFHKIRSRRFELCQQVLLLLIFLLIAAPCSAESEVEQAGSGKINLGVIVPLTGPLAFFGNDFVRTFNIVSEDHPGIKDVLNVLWEDSAYDSKQAVSVFNKLVSIDKADIVLSFGGPMLSALAPIAQSKKIPFFATESEKSDCRGREYCSLFRNEEDEWGRATWKALRKYGKKKIGIVKNQNQFMNTFVNAIARTKGDGESVEVLLDVSPDTVDLRSSVLTLKNKDVDALGVYFLPGSHHGFLNALKSANKRYFFFGVEEFLVKENNVGYEDIIDGALVVAPGYVDSYKDRFESKYGYSAGFFYTPAFYDFLILLADIIGKNPELRGIDLVKAMRFKGERSGVSGKYSVKVSDEGVHSYSFPISVYKVNKGGVEVDQVINF